MRKAYLFLLLCFLGLPVWAANYAPASQNAFSGAATYCQGATASALTFTYNTCSGSAFASGVACTVKWYYNTTNSTSTGTATLVATNNFNCATATLGGVTTGSQTYTPITTATGARYYFCVVTWTATSCNGTGGTVASTTTQLVTVNSTPSSATATANPTTLCSGATLTLSASVSGGTNLTYSWAGPSYGGSTSLNPAGFAVATANAGIYTLTIASAGCSNTVRTTSSVTVTTRPTSVSASAAPSPVCSGNTLSLTGAATGATSYSWAGPSYGGSSALNPSGFTASMANAGVFTLTATNTCGSTTATATANVVNTPPTSVSASAPASVCTGVTLSLTGAATNATSYSWAGPAGSGYSSTLLNPAGFAATSAHNGVFTLTATNGCGNTTATTTVSTGGAMAAITTNYSPAWMCTPFLVAESWENGVPTVAGTAVDGWNTSATSTSYYVQAGSGTYPTISGGHTGSSFMKFNSYSLNTIGESYGALRSPAFSMTGVTGATLSFWMYREVGGTYSGSAGYTVEGFKIYINTTTTVGGTQLGWVPRAADATPTGVTGTASPSTSGWYQYTVAIPGTYTGATNYLFFSGVSAYGDDCYLDDIYLSRTLTTTFTDVMTGGTWSSANTAIASVNGTGIITATGLGTTTITYFAAGCTIPATASLSVIDATPAITAAGSPTLICQGATLSLNGTYNGGTWSTSNSSVATVNSSGLVTGTGAGNVTITYALGCGSYSTYSLTVVGSPAPVTGTNYVCAGGSSTLSSTTTGYVWTSGNTAVASVNAATGMVSGLSAGTANITYSTGCGTDAIKSFTVNPNPSSISGPASVCTLSTAPAFTDVSTGVSAVWSNSPTTYGAINASTGVFTSTATAGTTTITYTVNYASGSCATTTSFSVSNTIPSTISPSTAAICTGSSVTLTGSPAGGSWSVAPASAGLATVNASGMVTGLSQGTAIISYNGCGSVTRNVTVTGYSGTVSSNSPICTGTTLSLTSSITPTPVYSWTGPSGFSSALATPTRTSATTAYSGIYTLSMTTGGCARTFTTSVTVSPVTLTVTPTAASFCNGTYATLTASAGTVTPTTMLTEGWESGVPAAPGTLADGWNTTATTATYYSQQSTGSNPTITNGHTGTYLCRLNSYSITAGTDCGFLISPAVSMSGYGNGSVSFWVYREVGGSYSGTGYYTEGFNVYVNTVSNLTGATLLGFVPRASLATPTGVTGTANPSASGWYQYSVSIPSTYSGTATDYILVKGISAYGNDCYLDDISVTASAIPVWSPTTRLYTNTTLTTAYVSGANVSTVYAAPTSSTVYSAAVGVCAQNAAITVAAQPSVTALTPSATTICAGQNMSLTVTTTGGLGTASYTWSGTGITTTTGSSGTSSSFTPSTTGAGTYSVAVSYTGTNCNTAASTTTVTTNALPVASAITGPSVSCIGSGTPMTLSTSTPVSGVGSLVSYNWSGPNGFSATTAPGSPSVSFTPTTVASAGIYSLTVTYSSGSCTSAPKITPSLTLGTVPNVLSITGGNGCSATGLVPGLATSQPGIRYKLKRLPSTYVDSVTGTGLGISFGSMTTAGAYVITANDATGCLTTMNGSDTVITTPSFSLGSVPSICQGATSVPVSYATLAGAPVKYNIDWNTTANAAGISDITNATLSGSSINLSMPATGALGTFSGTMTVSDGTCISSPGSTSITIYAVPALSVSSVNAPCINYAGSIDLVGIDGSTVDYRVDGGALNHFTFSGTTHSISTGVMTIPHTYQLVSASNPVCATLFNDTVTVTPIPMQWIGGVAGHETGWNFAANWTCGFEPTNIDDVTINSTTYAPAIPLSGSGTVKKLTIGPGVALSLNNGGVLNVKGDIVNNGTISGNGKVVLNNSSAQNISGRGTIRNLELSNSAGAAIAAGSHMVVGNVLTLTSGTLTTNDSLELASSDTAVAARVAPIPASGAAISGKVIVDQYIQGGYRRYRFWAHPFSDTISLSQVQSYIDITGLGGAANGFQTTPSNSPSAYRFDPYVANSSMGYDPGWRAFTKINGSAADTNKFHPGQGIRMFFRGIKGEGLGYAFNYTPSAATVKMTGHVNQGNVTVHLAKGSVTPANQDYNLVGNPYPSPVDIGTVLYNAAQAHQVTGSAFYVWNPAIGAGGQYMTVPIGTSGPIPYYIQANAAFEVRADHDGATLSFAESNKGPANDMNLFKAPQNNVRLNIYDENYHLWDIFSMQFDDKATDEDDRSFDAAKPMGTDFNFYSISADNRNLAIDTRPYENSKVVPLGIASIYQQDYIIRAENIAVPGGGSITLHDKLLGKYVALTAGSEYRFSVGKDRNTQGNDRFELALRPVADTTATAYLHLSMTPNPATDDVKISFGSDSKDDASLRISDMSGVRIYQQDLGAKQGGTVSISMSNFAAGVYLIEITQGDRKVTKRLVKE